MIPHQSVRDMAEVARKLGDLVHEVVFLGGAAVPLLVPAAVVPTVRSTDDVDCVVRAETYSEYSHVGERLRKLGSQECRDERCAHLPLDGGGGHGRRDAHPRSSLRMASCRGVSGGRWSPRGLGR